MNKKNLIAQIKQKQSFLIVGLDTDITKIPSFLLKEKDPVFSFNKAIIDATKDYCVGYKPNIAFYESLGVKGWESLAKTLAYIPPQCFTIADAKRGDIGNTAEQYAKTFFETYPFHALTVSPYMGEDSMRPFIKSGKWTVILALTSNKGSEDFQQIDLGNKKIYEVVLEKAARWGSTENTMFVVGATHPALFQSVRNIVPHHFLLVPGVGAQGGSLEEIAAVGLNKDIGLLVNASRSIIYSSTKADFAEKASKAAHKLQKQMASLLIQHKIL